MKYCPVYKKCGACSYINMNYEEQLEKKQEYVRRQFHDMKVEPVIGMKNPYHYRHKIYASFTHDRNGKISAGLYEESTHKVVNSEMCLIQNIRANEILKTICDLATSMHIESYDEKTGRGVLRHAYIRVSHKSGDVLLVLVIGSKELPGSRNFVNALRKKHPEIKTVILNYNHEFTSMILGKRDKILYGPGYITDEINGLVFRISCRSFYQVNPVQTETLYAEALKMAELHPSDKVLDVCCGIGTISLLAAGKVSYVLGIEVNPHAVRDAERNAKENHIQNAEFMTMDAERFIGELEDVPDVVFLDPPRNGFSGEFMHALGHLGPKKIVYISCNPETQARDTAAIFHDGYKVRKIVPVDMFPFTESIESVALLTKQH